jgi:hypothetical protein
MYYRNDFREAPDLNPHTTTVIDPPPVQSNDQGQRIPASDPNTPKPLTSNSLKNTSIPLYSFDQSPN